MILLGTRMAPLDGRTGPSDAPEEGSLLFITAELCCSRSLSTQMSDHLPEMALDLVLESGDLYSGLEFISGQLCDLTHIT